MTKFRELMVLYVNGGRDKNSTTWTWDEIMDEELAEAVFCDIYKKNRVQAFTLLQILPNYSRDKWEKFIEIALMEIEERKIELALETLKEIPDPLPVKLEAWAQIIDAIYKINKTKALATLQSLTQENWKAAAMCRIASHVNDKRIVRSFSQRISKFEMSYYMGEVKDEIASILARLEDKKKRLDKLKKKRKKVNKYL